MRTRSITVCTILLISGVLIVQAQDQGGRGRGPAGIGLTLATPAFADGSEIPPKYTQSVPNPVSPKLEWSNVSADTVAFVLHMHDPHMHDPDVALQKKTNDQLHWMVLNIPGTARELAEGIPTDPKLPDGAVQLKNGGNTVGYRGPGAPAAGPYHHYTIELYALDAKVDPGPDATRADVLNAIDGHIPGKAVLSGRFHR